ncbi:MAG: NYN domain-containing protein [Candidatus Diapherotrites archaeon]
MNLEKTLVFIDAGYLSKLSKHFGKGKYLKIDLIKFAKYLSIKQNLWCEHIFYYTAPPFQSSNPTEKESKLKSGYDSFISKLKDKKEISVREGRLQKIGKEFTQKGVDTLLTMDLAEEPRERKIQTIVLLACDTDFVPILNKLRNKHQIKVILYYFMDRKRKSAFSMSNHILTACDSKILLSEECFKRNLK